MSGWSSQSPGRRGNPVVRALRKLRHGRAVAMGQGLAFLCVQTRGRKPYQSWFSSAFALRIRASAVKVQ